MVERKNLLDALEMVSKGEVLDLSLTEVFMPGKVGGFELARTVRQTHPKVL